MYALNFLAFEKNNKWSGTDKNHSSSLPEIEAMKEDVLDSGVIDVSIMIGGVLTYGKDSPSYIDVFDKIKDMSQEELGDHMAHDYGSFDGYFNDKINRKNMLTREQLAKDKAIAYRVFFIFSLLLFRYEFQGLLIWSVSVYGFPCRSASAQERRQYQ